MTAPNRQNIWMAATTAERNLLGTVAGVAVGDFCLVEGVNLYVATSVIAGSGTWRPMGGVPTNGAWGLGGKNVDNTLNRAVFMLAGVTFSALLDAAPSSITLTPAANSNWPAVPAVAQVTAHGFTLSGTSNLLPTNTDAWVRGVFTINY
jgi:hypothetical protein